MTPYQSYDALQSYIRHHMRMSHVYQPVMLQVLLQHGGSASVEDIARALVGHDLSQIEYYMIRTRQMVGPVLARNGVVEPLKDGTRITGYRLLAAGLTSDQRSALMDLCRERLDTYIRRRGDGIWQHRNLAEGYVPGSVRYEVLKRAKYRCELCGGKEEQVALQIDHILPRARGGIDDISNYQALCMTCNTNKRHTDDTDFRSVPGSWDVRDPECLFCTMAQHRIVAGSQICYAVLDAFPVTDLHTLIIPRRHVTDYFALYQPELNAVHAMLTSRQDEIRQTDPSVTGFNIGINNGADAGQTIFHVHIHLIPRRPGDVAEPRGGVRGVIPARQAY